MPTQLWRLLPGLLWLQAACTPAFTPTIDGEFCNQIGSEACSTEPGRPRAVCGEDGVWRILQSCGDSGCFVQQTSPGFYQTACGGAPLVDTTTGSPDAGSASGADAAAQSDTTTQSDSTSGSVACIGGVCAADQVCAAVGRCESPGCNPPCGAGQLCTSGVCKDYCDGTCFTSEACSPAGVCTSLGCALPQPANGTVRLAVDAAVTPTNGSGGALLQALDLLGVHTGDDYASGLSTVALVEVAPATWQWLLARRTDTANCTSSICNFTASRSDNLTSVGDNPACAYRFGATAKLWPLPLRTNFERTMLWLTNPNAKAASSNVILVQGTVDGAAIRAALSATIGAKGLALPSDSDLAKLVPPGVDTSGDGQPDAWLVEVQLTTVAGKLSTWSP